MSQLVSTVEFRPQQDQQVQPQSTTPGTAQATSPTSTSNTTTTATFNPYPTSTAVGKPAIVSALQQQKPKTGGTITPKPGGAFKSKRVFKVIIIGDAGVGKTCLSYRFCNGRFPGATEATIGVDFRERSLCIDDELIRVQLWDTAGQERYRQSIVAHYYRNVNAVVFVYDVNNPQSFKSLPAWIAECKKHALNSGQDTPHILIGNKCDLLLKSTEQGSNPVERVKTDQAQIFADENDMALFETSALADSEADHVESIFITLVHKLRQSKPMHVQTTEERSQREQQKILLKADEAAKLDGDEEEAGMCC